MKMQMTNKDTVEVNITNTTLNDTGTLTFKVKFQTVVNVQEKITNKNSATWKLSRKQLENPDPI